MYFRLNFNRGSLPLAHPSLPNQPVASPSSHILGNGYSVLPPNMTLFHGFSVQILSVKVYPPPAATLAREFIREQSLRPVFAQLQLPTAAMQGVSPCPACGHVTDFHSTTQGLRAKYDFIDFQQQQQQQQHRHLLLCQKLGRSVNG